MFSKNRFDELVHHARKQDKVTKSLAQEKAKSLVSMLVKRHQYIKKREQFRENQFSSMSILGELLSPAVRVPLDLNGPVVESSKRKKGGVSIVGKEESSEQSSSQYRSSSLPQALPPREMAQARNYQEKTIRRLSGNSVNGGKK